MQPVSTLLLPRQPASVAMARASLSRALRAASVAPDDIADLSVALTEACSNVVRHAAGSGSYRVEVRMAGDHCTLVVTDRGPGFTLEHRELPDPSAESGRGIALMAALVDELAAAPRLGGGTVVTLAKQLSPTAGVAGGSRMGSDDAEPPNEEAHHG